LQPSRRIPDKSNNDTATAKPRYVTRPLISLRIPPTASADRMREKFAALDDETPFEGIECEGDDEETCWRRGLLYRALNAAGEAAYEDWTKFKVDAELVSAAERAAMAWRETAAYLRRLYRGNTKDT
jgi:hypothetical protein